MLDDCGIDEDLDQYAVLSARLYHPQNLLANNRILVTGKDHIEVIFGAVVLAIQVKKRLPFSMSKAQCPSSSTIIQFGQIEQLMHEPALPTYYEAVKRSRISYILMKYGLIPCWQQAYPNAWASWIFPAHFGLIKG